VLSEAFAKKTKNVQVRILLEALKREKGKTHEVSIRFEVLMGQFKQKLSLSQQYLRANEDLTEQIESLKE